MSTVAADGATGPMPSTDGDRERPASTTTTRRSGLGRWRRPLGLVLLLATVFLWTASNFLQSTIFADNTYSKPYFVTYVNSAFFIVPLAPILAWRAYRRPDALRQWWGEVRGGRYAQLKQEETEGSVYMDGTGSKRQRRSISDSQELLLGEHTDGGQAVKYQGNVTAGDQELTIPEIVKLALQFSLVWYLSNYTVAACLEYTTVASSTIINNTSSIFTLIFGAMFGVERFTLNKVLAVIASMLGMVLICSIDLFGSDTDENRGDFPKKTMREMAIGDIFAFASATMYGFYAVFMKKRVGSESRVNMPIFFGFVGLFNVLFLWPVFIILHYANIERFELPPTRRVTTILLLNSASSLVSDFFWAYAVLLTSPIVVTVGLSMSIPLSLIGQIVLHSQIAPTLYWIGACVMLVSFIFVNLEEKEEKKIVELQEDVEQIAFADEQGRTERRPS